MKKLIYIAAILAAGFSSFAQGTVRFSNRETTASPPIDAPVFDVGGTVRLGPTFLTQLYAGAAGTAEAALTAVGTAVPFRSGNAAGYIVASDLAIPGIAAGATAVIQMRAWDSAAGATYDAARAAGGKWGQSGLLNITLGGAGSPPSLPALLTGLGSFTLVPEPSTFALGAIGLAALLLRRRK
jgi:hypothetical protein